MKYPLVIILKIYNNYRTGLSASTSKALSLHESKDPLSHRKQAFLALKSTPLNFLLCHFLYM